MKHLFFFFLILLPVIATAQERQPMPPLRPVKQDTLRRLSLDSLHRGLPDSLHTGIRHDSVVVDSLGLRLIPGIGTIRGKNDTNDVFAQQQLIWTDAKGFQELMWKIPGFFWRDLGEDGKTGELSAYGIDGRGISVLLDGRPMNDPVTGTYNLYQMPMELIDHLETAEGSDAAGFGSGNTGVGMNFVTREYNSVKALTKIRYVQDPDNTLQNDVLYTQNLARGLNFMFGLQRSTSDGRYTNSPYDGWNIRTRLRYDPTNRFNISLTEFFTKSSIGENGGVSGTYTSIFDESGTTVTSEDAWSKMFRHDITLAATARLLPDSSALTQTNIFYTHINREYRQPEGLYSDVDIDDITRAVFWGIRVQQEVPLPLLHLTTGVQALKRQTEETAVLPGLVETEKSAFATARVSLDSIVLPSASAQITNLRGTTLRQYGAGIEVRPLRWFALSGDASVYDRMPTIQEAYWRDTTLLRPATLKKEHHRFLQGGFSIQLPSFSVSAKAFYRKVDNAIIFTTGTTSSGTAATILENIAKQETRGVTGSAFLAWNHFSFYGTTTLSQIHEDDTVRTKIPDILASGELAYRNTFFKNALDIKFGVRSQFHNRESGMTYLATLGAFEETQDYTLGRATVMDIFTVFSIGSAHLSLSWNNILGAQYMYSSIYPMAGRSIRIGVHWVFLD